MSEKGEEDEEEEGKTIVQALSIKTDPVRSIRAFLVELFLSFGRSFSGASNLFFFVFCLFPF
jgi:hypothetical protein